MTKRAISGVMGNSGEGKQFKPFDLSGNLTLKLFLKKINVYLSTVFAAIQG